MKGKDFIRKTELDAMKWNHGVIPEIGIRHTFLVNGLEDKYIFTEKELYNKVEEIMQLMKKELLKIGVDVID